MLLIPNIIEKNYNGEKIYDIYTKLLTKRIVFITGEINDDLANLVTKVFVYVGIMNNFRNEIDSEAIEEVIENDFLNATN